MGKKLSNGYSIPTENWIWSPFPNYILGLETLDLGLKHLGKNDRQVSVSQAWKGKTLSY